MPTIRSICWNINNFKGSSWTKHGNTIMETIYDAAGTRLLDMFVVVEPYSKMKAFGLGDNVTDGAGLDGVLSLYFALAAKDLRWKVAPLRTTAMPPTSDMIAPSSTPARSTAWGPTASRAGSRGSRWRHRSATPCRGMPPPRAGPRSASTTAAAWR